METTKLENLYKFMGLDEDATQEQIKSTYLTLAKKYHPDKGGNQQLYEKLNKVYNVLKDTEKRKIYDSIRKETLTHDHFELVNNFKQTNNNYNNKDELKETIPKETIKKITADELSKRIKQKRNLREQEDCEILQQKMDLTKEEFNAMFETMRETNGEITDVQEFKNYEPINFNEFNNCCEYNDLQNEKIYDDPTFSKFEETITKHKIPKKIDVKKGTKYCDKPITEEELNEKIKSMKNEMENTKVNKTILGNTLEPLVSIEDNILTELDDLDKKILD